VLTSPHPNTHDCLNQLLHGLDCGLYLPVTLWVSWGGQDTLPAHCRAFAPKWQRSAEETESAAVSHQERLECNCNKGTRELPEL
jgi:hypothetical protein